MTDQTQGWTRRLSLRKRDTETHQVAMEAQAENGLQGGAAGAAGGGEVAQPEVERAETEEAAGISAEERQKIKDAAALLLADAHAMELLDEETRKKMAEKWGDKKEKERRKEKNERERLRRENKKRQRAELEAQIEALRVERLDDSEGEAAGGVSAAARAPKRVRPITIESGDEGDDEANMVDAQEEAVAAALAVGQRGKTKGMEGAAGAGVPEWDVNCFLLPAKVGRDGTCLIPKDNATAGALARGPNPDGEYKLRRRWPSELVKKVLKEWAAQLTRERDSVTDRTEKREAERARKVAEAAAVLMRFFDGCTNFPDL
uniref:Uncharacterized protein n=1 Tax=Chromera velia CCMP2878 TaxID=1169474 RepID=A0A0G4GM31_9ALVE|eukprot:Cvel_22472.t1-p1 / transcript=Cvel_22472.t1 / gene=Cvel_22472 / organism=Chromera_velia_CCMP2878 / gene_product=hypothetical protein / transcript_product=hypothetical protein / location=Cvel_scaffold2212:5556-6837(-) / protein_length=317 / sequence_SO=supercontig / SO=protein_coding / is_pseudo=false